MNQHALLSLGYFGAAGLWPSLSAAIERALMSPLERAMRDAVCGLPDHAGLELLGHCTACWAGSAVFVAAGLAVLMAKDSTPVRAR